MKKKYINKKAKRRIKINLKKKSLEKVRFSKRMGGIINVTMELENRNLNALDLSQQKKEI